MYVRFLRSRYFPFLVKYNKYICLLWIIVFIICLIYGPNFLSNTKSNLDLPKNSPSNVSLAAFKKYYPDFSDWPPMFIVQTANNGNKVINDNYSKTISKILNEYAAQYSDTISGISGYWELINDVKYSSTAINYVSDDGYTMYSSVSFYKSASLDEINDIAEHFLKWIPSLSNNNMNIYPTGLFVLFKEMSLDTEKNFTMIDSIVLPIAIVILGLYLRSYRHMFVSLSTLGCTILLALGILYPISNVVDINPFAPSIMLSCGIAVSFDYSLFLLTRFKEEYLINGKSREDAVFSSVEAAGHVVLLSGSTLIFTFIILIALPQNFLSSVGFVCGVIVFTSILSNISLLPSILLAFSCFSHFDVVPTRSSCCCFVSQALKDEETYDQKNNIITWNKDIITSNVATKNANNQTYDEVEKVIGDNDEVTIAASISPRTLWFKLAFYSTQYAGPFLILIFCCTAPFLWKFCTMIPSSDDNLIYLRDSVSLNGLNIMTKSFKMGKLDPYLIIMDTGDKGIFTSTYFEKEKIIINEIVGKLSPKYIKMDGITSLTRFGGYDITYSMATSYFDSTSANYNQAFPSMYREYASQILANEKKVSMIRMETELNPNSQQMTEFIKVVRKILIENSDDDVQGNLMGGYSTNYDVQSSLYALVPMMIGVTLAVVLIIVSISFGSVFLAFRLLVTVFIGLCWTYGLTVMVYQPGQPQNDFAVLTPYIKSSTGIYWIIPIMAFSILVGLALDYDIFLISRFVEYRKLGWSDRASICLAVEKTGGIITTAGVIMSVSFAGLLLPKATVLNQYGFVLFMGVVIDTFLIRTFVVPACVTVGGYECLNGLNWWPLHMPPQILSADEETAALLAGYDVPILVNGKFPIQSPRKLIDQTDTSDI